MLALFSHKRTESIVFGDYLLKNRVLMARMLVYEIGARIRHICDLLRNNDCNLVAPCHILLAVLTMVLNDVTQDFIRLIDMQKRTSVDWSSVIWRYHKLGNTITNLLACQTASL